ncbi:MAG: hypothetical protein DMF85_03340 [Acidobacteria bacterium]|nr:MAG: hypothetical protein DMF85_03340 [Acidobacteriota bacterium]
MTASDPIATVHAPQAARSTIVPRTAEPAPITSLTIATRRPRTAARSAPGIRYSTGKSPPRPAFSKRSAYANGSPSVDATISATNAPSTSGPQISSGPCARSRAASCSASCQIGPGSRQSVSRSSHTSP